MRFQFLHEYFKKNKLNDFNKDIHITITEQPSFDIKEEDYSFRLETHHPESIHRNYAIEHHLSQKHDKPHLQFKFSSEKIGSIWFNLFFKDEEEYKKGIEGFIFHSKNVFEELEQHRENICDEMLHLEKISNLHIQGAFLQERVAQSIKEGLIEFKQCIDREKQQLIESHELLNAFIGKHNTTLLLDNLK